MPFQINHEAARDHVLSFDSTTYAGHVDLVCSCGADLSFDCDYRVEDVIQVMNRVAEHLDPILAERVSEEEVAEMRERHRALSLLIQLQALAAAPQEKGES